MFTGIIETTGEVAEIGGGRLAIRTPLARELRESDSIAVNGVCLTALQPDANSFHADLSPETLRRTNLGQLSPGALVNLERPLQPASRLGGHFVQGHADGVAEVVKIESVDSAGNYWLDVRVPPDLLRYVAWKGSVALNGISLTIAALDRDVLGVAVIPYTYEHTNLRAARPGDFLNVECDLIARYLERLLKPEPAAAELTIERLLAEGF